MTQIIHYPSQQYPSLPPCASPLVTLQVLLPFCIVYNIIALICKTLFCKSTNKVFKKPLFVIFLSLAFLDSIKPIVARSQRTQRPGTPIQGLLSLVLKHVLS